MDKQVIMGVGCVCGGAAKGTISGFIPLSKCDISMKACQQIKVHHTHDSVVDFSFFCKTCPGRTPYLIKIYVST